jgi:hypothetical protein
MVEIRTNACRSLERAIQAALEVRGTQDLWRWHRNDSRQILTIYKFIVEEIVYSGRD